MSCEIGIGSKFAAYNTYEDTWTFMYCPFVLHARVFHSFMYYPFVLSKVSFWSCMMVGFHARVFHSFMYGPFVLSKTSFCSCLMVALLACTDLMHWVRLPFVVAWCLHCPKGYLTPSFTALLCWARLPFVVAWWLHFPQMYLTPSCTVPLCSLPTRVFESFL